LRVLAAALALVFCRTLAEAETVQACTVKWEKDCIDALLKRHECPLVFGTLSEKGTLTVDTDRSKVRTRDLGIVTEYSFVRRPGELMLEGSRDIPGYYMRGHGTLDPASGRLKLYFTLGKSRDDANILQRGLEADCR
jgi:hypothetical protein